MELKEIAPYLAHKLKMLDTQEGVWELDAKNHYGVAKRVGLEWALTEIATIKPILHPLSDLTKPCLEGGGVPIVELAEIAFPNHEWKLNGRETFAVNGTYGMVFEFDAAYGIFLRDDSANVIDQLSLFNWLYEHHFWLGDQDRFGKDIIDVNNIQNGDVKL